MLSAASGFTGRLTQCPVFGSSTQPTNQHHNDLNRNPVDRAAGVFLAVTTKGFIYHSVSLMFRLFATIADMTMILRTAHIIHSR